MADRQNKYDKYYQELTPEYLDKIQEGQQHSSNAQYDDFSALVDDLIDDRDGSFTKQLLADNKDIVDAFNTKVQEKIKQEEQQAIAQEAQREVAEKSFGGRSSSQ